MRTRSQQASPGGFVSLDTERAPRRTRSTRAASQQSSSQPDTSEHGSEQTAEPVTQSATRPKSKRTVKKATTKKTSPSTTTSQTEKAPKRVTRKTTRKTDNPVSDDEEQKSINEEHPETTQGEEKENPEASPEESVSAQPTADNALLEPRSSERESQHFLPSPQTPQAVEEPQPLETPNDLQDFLELLNSVGNIDDEFDLPNLGETPCPAWYDLEFEELTEGICARLAAGR
ncbi:hypothetical protein AOCH_007036 [Aspergillus ochraceoroseus]|uniref:Uncharacterized protein n=1 Tax=Aspergillus ochraceoroseus TaxID=138278 RepID=A0A0F8XCG5_9EURO|nr:hypothetical protein AOCH_007036 [Aspergillus ochraceoroseus]